MDERDRLLAMARKEYEKDPDIKDSDIQQLVDEMIKCSRIPKVGDRSHFHKTAYTIQQKNVYNHYKNKYREFLEHCRFITEGKTEIDTMLYRGTRLERHFKIGQRTSTGVASWSKDLEVAQNFGDTIYILEGSKWATSLNEYSVYSSEKEFLVTGNIQVEVKNISYKVVGVKRKRFIRWEVVDGGHSDLDSEFSELRMHRMESFLLDESVSSDDFEFHKYLLGKFKSATLAAVLSRRLENRHVQK